MKGCKLGHPIVEAIDGDGIVRAQFIEQTKRGGLERRQGGFHAAGGIEQQRHGDARRVVFERGNGLRMAAVDDGEFFGCQVVDVTAAAVGDGGIDLDEVAAGAEKGLGRSRNRRLYDCHRTRGLTGGRRSACRTLMNRCPDLVAIERPESR